MPISLIRNATLITPYKRIENASIQINAGRITAVEQGPGTPGDSDEIFDAQGLLTAPGFIELQLNGGFGHDFTTEPESIWQVGPQLLQHGVTSFLPTIISCPPKNIRRAMQVVQQGPPRGYCGPNVLGLHLEGPFLSPAKKGAHNTAFFQSPDPAFTADWRPENGVRIATLAPEVEGAPALIRQLVSQGLTVSAGHTNASYDQAVEGINAGLTMGTHLFNAMSALNHRDPGMVGALLEDDRVRAGLIADGIHVHPAAVSLALKAKGPQNLILVTDAMSALGMPPGEYPQIEDTVYVDGTSARLADGLLAGSILTLDSALRNLIAFSGCTLDEALPTVTSTPAACIHETGRGEIKEGNEADLVFLNQDLTPAAVIVGGELGWG